MLDKENEIMKTWYQHNYILYEMLYAAMFDRETCFMIPKHRCKGQFQRMFRYYKIFHPKGIGYVLGQEIETNTPLQIYTSLAKYNDMPIFKGNPLMRKSDTQKWRDNCWRDMATYDLLVDIDVPDSWPLRQYSSMAKEDTTKIINLLDRFNMPYHLRFSGNGYHVIIPYRYFNFLDLSFNPNEVGWTVYDVFNRITQKLHDDISEFIDTGLHDSARITKCPYSLAFYKDGTYVCWPFNSKIEFNGHVHTDYKLNNALKFHGEQKIFRRSQELFNKDTWKITDTYAFLEHLGIEVQDNMRDRTKELTEIRESGKDIQTPE